MNTGQFDRYLASRRQLIEAYLGKHLPPASKRPVSIHRAMRYAVLGGGKRLRALLVLASGEAAGGARRTLLPAAAAFECLHAYSLVHDDLPCMDDDDLRRGQPTVHRVYGEGLAVLAGDALLTLAFELMAGQRAAMPPGRSGRALALFARAAGTEGLIGGQVMDIEAEGHRVSMAGVRDIHGRKTGAMITAAVEVGACLGGASDRDQRAVRAFGRAIGLAFQVIDDCLNETSESRVLGKKARSDRARKKATYPRVMGVNAAFREAARLEGVALKALRPMGPRGRILAMLAQRMVRRER